MRKRQVTEDQENHIESYVIHTSSYGAECSVKTANGKRKLTTKMRMLHAYVMCQNPKR